MFGDKIKRSQFSSRENDTYVFRNIFLVPKVFSILASDWVKIAYPLSVTPTVIANGQLDYNQLILDKEINPKVIKGIRLLQVDSLLDINQWKNPLQWVTQDSSGTYKSFVDYPLNLLPLDQYQTRVIDIYYDNLVIGGNQWFFYKMQPNSIVSMTFVYDEFRLENLLDKNNPRQVIYSKGDIELFDKLL